jgi:Inositol hexakisphosphate
MAGTAGSDRVMAPPFEPLSVPVKVDNPLLQPYRTGSYLVYDVLDDTPGKPEHFRSGFTLTEHPFKASGSHQLDANRLTEILKAEVVARHHPSEIFLVDLREETHGFLNGRAVSWYADNDFANVGQSLPWIMTDEHSRLALVQKQPTARVFAIETDCADNREQDRKKPKSYQDIEVAKAETEQMVSQGLGAKLGCPVTYVRIPVTDHCAPTEAALKQLREDVWKKVSSNSWVHFHCHGGDGRTTTFLALFDMLCWKPKASRPSLEVFACRQCELFTYYLDPKGSGCGECTPQPITKCTEWKLPLAEERWTVLEVFRDDPAGGLAR